MRHGNMGQHMVTRRDPGMETCLFSPLLVLPVACRGLGARHQSLLTGLEPLRSLVVCFIASFTVLASHWSCDGRIFMDVLVAHSQGLWGGSPTLPLGKAGDVGYGGLVVGAGCGGGGVILVWCWGMGDWLGGWAYWRVTAASVALSAFSGRSR